MPRGFTLWFTGMSGSGKSTLSHLLESRLRQLGAKVEVLDGDIIRTHLSKGDLAKKTAMKTSVELALSASCFRAMA